MACMSSENLINENVDKNPDLSLAQLKFKLSLPEYAKDKVLKTLLLEGITKNVMAPWYEIVCQDLKWKLDKSLLKKMKAENERNLNEIEKEVNDSAKFQTHVEIRSAVLKKANYLSRICDEKLALESLQKVFHKTTSLIERSEITFHCIRIGLFFMNHEVIEKQLEIAEYLIEEGGNWDLRNKLKVYKGLYLMSIRKFNESSELFLETISTFMSPEIMDYSTFVKYAVLTSIVALPRKELKDKIVHNSEILTHLHSEKQLKSFIFTLYDCKYAEFFIHLAEIEQELKSDYFFSPHYRYYVREMKIKAYGQLLESYNSLSLDFMAKQFGVTAEYIDEDLSKYIAAGRIVYKIDRVGGIVETGRSDYKTSQFQHVIRQGDLLLNRIQKLSRVINI